MCRTGAVVAGASVGIKCRLICIWRFGFWIWIQIIFTRIRMNDENASPNVTATPTP